jgi:hypothetical protein
MSRRDRSSTSGAIATGSTRARPTFPEGVRSRSPARVGWGYSRAQHVAPTRRGCGRSRSPGLPAQGLPAIGGHDDTDPVRRGRAARPSIQGFLTGGRGAIASEAEATRRSALPARQAVFVLSPFFFLPLLFEPGPLSPITDLLGSGVPVRRIGLTVHRAPPGQASVGRAPRVMTTLPRALPASTWRIASGICSNGTVRSMTGRIAPAST